MVASTRPLRGSRPFRRSVALPFPEGVRCRPRAKTYSQAVTDALVTPRRSARLAELAAQVVGQGAVAIERAGTGADERTSSCASVADIQSEFSKFDLKWLLPLKSLPLSNNDSISDRVTLTTNLRSAVSKIRKVCKDVHPTAYVRGWEEVLQRYIMKYVKLTGPDSTTTSQVITNAFAVVDTLLDDGVPGSDVLRNGARIC